MLAVCQKGLYFGFSFSRLHTEAQPETVAAWKNLQIKNRQIILDREIFNPILNMKNWSRQASNFPMFLQEFVTNFMMKPTTDESPVYFLYYDEGIFSD